MMEIICNNEEFVTVIKPFGVSSQENGKDGLPELIKKELSLTEIYTVHRLDTVTSGVMVYAKTKRAAAVLSKGITDGTFQKEYLTVVHGEVSPEKGIMEDFLTSFLMNLSSSFSAMGYTPLGAMKEGRT